jgi:hypothetical protein
VNDAADLYVPAPVLECQPPPELTGTARAVLALLGKEDAGVWVPCPRVLHEVSASANRVRAVLRQLAACGWAERRYRIGPQPLLVYRLTETGRAHGGD